MKLPPWMLPISSYDISSKSAGARELELHQRDEALAPGEDFDILTEPRQQRGCLADRARNVVVERGRNHRGVPRSALRQRPIPLCGSASGTIRPCSGRIWSTVRLSRLILSARFTQLEFKVGGGGAFGAGGLYTSASTRSFSFGRYAMITPAWWLLPGMFRISTVRVPSVSTRLSRMPSTVPFFPDFARRSGRTVAGAASAFSRKGLFTSWAMTVMPSAAIARSPPA